MNQAVAIATSSRRTFLRKTFIALGVISVSPFGVTNASPFAAAAEQMDVFKGKDVFDRILHKAVAAKWVALPIGDLMGKIAQELEGTPYTEKPLELSVDREVCSVNLTALDCVTFFETTLAFARMLKKGGRTPEALLSEVSFTRYRGGVAGDFSTRLHYTSDWFADNEKKGVVKLLSQLPGAETFRHDVSFMTNHRDSYPQLVAHPELVAKIKRQEETINSRTMKYIPMDKIAAVEPLLKTGDIVGVCTSRPGMDIAHTGLVFVDKEGVAHFMDASSMKSKRKVTIEPGPISRALNWSKDLTGAMFARPLEPAK